MLLDKDSQEIPNLGKNWEILKKGIVINARDFDKKNHRHLSGREFTDNEIKGFKSIKKEDKIDVK